MDCLQRAGSSVMMSFLIKSLSLFDTLKKRVQIREYALIPSIGKDCQAAQWYQGAPCEPYGMALMELIPTYSVCVTRIRILVPHGKDISQEGGEGRLSDTQRGILCHVPCCKCYCSTAEPKRKWAAGSWKWADPSLP